MNPSKAKSLQNGSHGGGTERRTRAKKKARATLAQQVSSLQEQLREARATLDAIRLGEVDALVVKGRNGPQIYSLAGAEEPYRVYIERMQEGAVTVAAGGLILYCNQRFADMLGVSLAKVIGSSLAEKLPPSSLELVSGVVMRADEVVKHETVLERGGREALPVNLTASRLAVGGHDVVCLVVTDLSDQKEKAELRVAKEVAEKANAAKDEFLAKLSHELRTPLTPTLMLASELERNPVLPQKARKEAAMIRRNIELEASLIDDLLDLTRIAGGKLELRLRPADLHHLIERSVAICQLDLDAKRLKLALQLEAPRPQVFVDTVRLQQAVWNLIRNAIKFTPPGGRISVSTGNEGARIWVAISDEGIGFDAATAPKLFQAFEQGGQHITRKFGGLGLGLAISRSIIESHFGTIRGESEGKGRGATFTLELPLTDLRETAVPALPAVGSALPSKAQNAKPRALCILLVEDHNDTRFALELILGRDGHTVKSASTAAGAVELAGQQRFDLVISDLGLPDQSGLDLMRTLRERFGLQGIAVSGFGMEEDLIRSREAGFTQHITKPIRMDRLKKIIGEIGADVVAHSGPEDSELEWAEATAHGRVLHGET